MKPTIQLNGGNNGEPSKEGKNEKATTSVVQSVINRSHFPFSTGS